MTEQWQELKETITEMRDNDGTCTQQETCKFLANLMDVLEKQMQQQEPCKDANANQHNPNALNDVGQHKNALEGDAISRQAVEEIINDIRDCISVEGYWAILERMKKLPPVTPQPKTGKWLITPMSHIAYCSECDHLFKDIPASVVKYFKYCPNCNVKMAESEEQV